MKRILIIVLSATLNFPVFAQQTALLKGKICESTSGQPIEGAVIYIESLQKGTESLEDGNYELQIPIGKYNVSVLFLGYKTQTQEVV
jgi:hypothetical protein